jgi:glycosyltransferase involved in cell wall biosynthesis
MKACHLSDETDSSQIKVAVFNSSERYGGWGAGVDKHVKHMVAGLAKQPGFTVDFWVPKDFWERDRLCVGASPLSAVRSSKLPLSRRTLLALSFFTGRPSVEQLVGSVDWAYCPREVLVATRQSRSAVTVHDVYTFEADQWSAWDWRKRMRRAVLARAVESATVVLTVSEFSKSRICEIFSINPEKVGIVGNGVEESFFDASKIDPEAASPLPKLGYFVSIGGFTRKKGARNLLEFATILQRQSKPLHLVVIGPIEEEYASDVQSQKNVIAIERGMTDEDIARWVRGSIAAVMLSEYEGFGIPMLEAMAAGVPVIASARGALPEVVGDAGLVVEPRRFADLEAAVGIWNDRTLRDQLIELGRRRAQTMRWSQCVSKLAARLREFGREKSC